MKTCHITTYWPTSNYGHTHYTENLMRGMRAHRPEKHFILAAEPAASPTGLANVTADKPCESDI
jgi:hypothetical protein